jgi:hypothetical protein
MKKLKGTAQTPATADATEEISTPLDSMIGNGKGYFQLKGMKLIEKVSDKMYVDVWIHTSVDADIADLESYAK